MINRNLYKRLERLEARAMAPGVSGGLRIVLVNDGTPGATRRWASKGRRNIIGSYSLSLFSGESPSAGNP